MEWETQDVLTTNDFKKVKGHHLVSYNYALTHIIIIYYYSKLYHIFLLSIQIIHVHVHVLYVYMHTYCVYIYTHVRNTYRVPIP